MYFAEQLHRKLPYLRIEWWLAIVTHPVARVVQEDGRIRSWGYVAEMPDRAIRVVTLADGETLHNAFPDSGFTRRTR